ncbi:hypothetical protein ElP_08270 [Tautonia plasticadhaerens]|uniref:Uncharacterized protein n=1 Tax=Tautonia plasticadhaerens TaxID=2527974 RepID=A0A518GWK6_9BACT|nr:hypothetical protein ElP_08270 [Tautonia plasticadhaerens]
MRPYQGQHRAYCGVDLHARTMYLCILDPDGRTLLHRDIPANPDAFLDADAPHRDGLVVACECTFSWYRLADTCAEHGIPFVLGAVRRVPSIGPGMRDAEGPGPGPATPRPAPGSPAAGRT